MIRSRRHPFRLQRLARSACARVFAHAMAVLLLLANLSAWAMPAAQAAGVHATPATASAQAHRHCDEATAQADMGKQQPPHGKGCPCCVGGACACLYSCSAALITSFPDLAPPPAAQLPLTVGTAFHDAAGERRLRPPIA
jgi:hypothetical protein